jgi:hypothetical protein
VSADGPDAFLSAATKDRTRTATEPTTRDT